MRVSPLRATIELTRAQGGGPRIVAGVSAAGRGVFSYAMEGGLLANDPIASCAVLSASLACHADFRRQELRRGEASLGKIGLAFCLFLQLRQPDFAKLRYHPPSRASCRQEIRAALGTLRGRLRRRWDQVPAPLASPQFGSAEPAAWAADVSLPFVRVAGRSPFLCSDSPKAMGFLSRKQ